jgi:hypothetical protein
VIHGLLLIALVDHIKSLKLIKAIRRFTKIVFFLYLVLIIMRIGVYFKVEDELVDIDGREEDKSFGNFLASYIPDKQGAIAFTCILLALFGFCFLMNCITLRLATKIESFVTKPASGPTSF